MATEAIQQLLSYPCGATSLATNQFNAVTIVGGLIVTAVAGKNMDGILQDKPIIGQAGTICRDGISKAAITASSAVLAGSLLEVDTGGTFKLLASGTAVARALEATGTVAYVAIITVEILRSNAVFL